MFLTRRFYIVMTVVILVLASGYLWHPAFIAGRWMLWAFILATVIDVALLWSHRGITARRHCPERLSNGDDNRVTIEVSSSYRFPVSLEVIDEVPIGINKSQTSNLKSQTSNLKSQISNLIEYCGQRHW